MNVIEIWDSVLKLIEPEVPKLTFNTWFKDAKPVSINENTVTLAVTNDLVLNMLKRHTLLIKGALETILENPYEVNIIISDGENIYIRNEEEEKKKNSASNNLPSFINPKYTFDNFVVGNSNLFAHAAAVAAAEAPGQGGNPLLLYGNSGLGKTHLMLAIANYAKMSNPALNIVYISSEMFTNELVSAIAKRTTADFRSKYRTADILLIDDVQFLAGKEMAQEEFFHTFNDLHNANKQIVLTSDRLPREIPTLEERLRTRFECGLMADINPPDYETRIAILQKKAAAENVEVPYDVYCYISDSIKSNIRELEGALTRIISYSKLTGKVLTLPLAEEALSSIIEKEGVVRITSKSINETVSKYYGIDIEDIKGKRKTQDVADARQICMYLCRKLTDMSFVVIGKEYNRHYTTVIYAVDSVEKQIKTNKEISSAVEIMTKQLKSILK